MIFLRPWALLLLLVPLGFVYKGYKAGYFQSAWKNVLDPHLMPHMMVRQNNQGIPKGALYFLAVLWVWLTIAAAGPAFYKTTVETAAKQKGLVVVLDMSPAMTEQKLFMAQLKLYELLKKQKETLVGFVMTDKYAYTVLPITLDTTLFRNIVPTLSRKVIPVQGSNPAAGIRLAAGLLQQSGLKSGQILLITGGLVDEAPLVKAIANVPYPVSILGIGTSDKVPANIGNGLFWEQSKGVPYLTTINADILSKHTRFAYNTLDNADLNTLLPQMKATETTKTDETVKIYQDIGIYMLVPALVFVALAFKPGILWSVLIVFCLSGSVRAAPPFLRAEQKAYEVQAQAVKAYRGGQYEQAALLFSKDTSADGFYNAGNAFAHMGDVDKAIAAYKEALKRNPHHADAQFNLDYLKQQQPPPPPQEQQSQSDKRDSSDGQSQADNQSGTNSQEQSSDASDTSDTQNQSDTPPDSDGKGQDADMLQSVDKTPQSAKDSDRETPLTMQEGTPDNKGQEHPITQDDQRQQEWLDRVQSDPGRVLKYRLYRQYKEQLQ